MYFYNQRIVWLSLKSANERYCEWHRAKDSSLFVKLMFKNSISGDIVTGDIVNVGKWEQVSQGQGWQGIQWSEGMMSRGHSLLKIEIMSRGTMSIGR
jgi:hypothetical protein